MFTLRFVFYISIITAAQKLEFLVLYASTEVCDLLTSNRPDC